MAIGGTIGSSVSVSVSVGAAGSVAPIGDTLANSEALFGFNKMRTAYSGSALKVERSSDGTTQDIGFGADGLFDGTALNTFVGGGTARLHTWFDQSGNSKDLTQTTDSLQPIIEQDGDGYWHFKCEGGDFVQQASFLASVPTNASMFVLWQTPSSGTFGGITAGMDFATGTNGFFTPYWTIEKGPTSRTQSSSLTEGYSKRLWSDKKPRLTGYKNLAGTESHYDGPSLALSGHTNDIMDFARITVGKNDFAAGNEKYYTLAIWDEDVDWDPVWAFHKDRFADMWSYSGDMYIVIGDSQTSTRFPGINDTWLEDTIVTESLTDVYAFARGGWRIQDWIDSKDEFQDLLSEITVAGTTRAIVWVGTNDMELDGLTGAQAYAKFETLIGHLQDAGVDEIYGMTAMPRGGDTSIGAPESDFNTAMKADADLTDVVELDSNSNLTDSTNGTYFNVDEVHLTDAGHDQVATEVSAIATANSW